MLQGVTRIMSLQVFNNTSIILHLKYYSYDINLLMILGLNFKLQDDIFIITISLVYKLS